MNRNHLLVLGVISTACASCVGNIDSADDGIRKRGAKIVSIGEQLKVHRFSANTYLLARDLILENRPKGTQLFVEHLNMVLANSNIANLTLSDADVEAKVKESYGESASTATCPFVKDLPPASTVSCRHLTDLALDAAVKVSAGMVADAEQGFKLTQGNGAMKNDEIAFLKERVAESMRVGLDAGKVHTMLMLRDKAVCDQTSDQTASALNFGAQQGRALFAQAAKKVLPTISRNQCNTDLIATTVLAEAKAAKKSFIEQNPLCPGFKPEELPGIVDLGVADQNRVAGLEEGMKNGYEALRARLVKDWDCNACVCISGDEGKLPEVCFLRSQLEKKGYLMEGLSIWEEIKAGDTHSLYELAKSGEQQCKSERCKQLVEQYTKDECGCGGPVTLTAAQKAELDEACPDGIPFPFQIASPLVVDLDGDGIRTEMTRIAFDLSATGKKVKMPALAGADALLALDLDGNRRIDSGAELFGNSTRCGATLCTDGLEALAQHDSNHDGVIDSKDSVYRKLQLWRDRNHDGISTSDELRTLSQAGIRMIELRSRLDVGFVDLMGNTATRAFSFVRTDGSRGLVPDVWFSVH